VTTDIEKDTMTSDTMTSDITSPMKDHR